MSESTIDVQPIRIVKEEEIEETPNVNTSSNNTSTSSSPTSIPIISKQESDDHEASDALSSINKTLLDQAHDGLLGLAQLNNEDDTHNNTMSINTDNTNQQDHISDSDDDENESVSKVSALYSLLQEDSDDGEHISSLPPSATVGTNTPTLPTNTHLAKRAAARQQQEQLSNSAIITTSSGGETLSPLSIAAGSILSAATNGSSTPKSTRKKRKSSRRSAMEDDEIADAGEMEDDDEYIADGMEDDDEEMALAGVKKRSSTRRERSPSLGSLNGAGSASSELREDEIISEEDLIHCVVCKRSNLQVNFKKNYTINTNNYKTYCDTFPQQSDQIPKPRDGESLSVCSTCYNKQWRFARGQYDPNKSRVVNKREGLKKPPKLKDSPRPEGGVDTPTLGGSFTPTLEESPAIEGKKRKVTKRRASTSTEDALNTSGIKDENGDEETPKKKTKRAAKAKKLPLPTPPPLPPSTADTQATVSPVVVVGGIASTVTASATPTVVTTIPAATNMIPISILAASIASSTAATPASSIIPITNAIPSPSPNKRGRKSKNPPANIGIVSGAPAFSYKKEENLSPPPPPPQVISNTALLISYMKRINGVLEEIYTTKIVTQHCPDTLEQLRDVVMERLIQKKGDLFTFDRACCNSVDRFNNSIKVEVDEFFFNDVKLNNNDSLCIYINDKQQQ